MFRRHKRKPTLLGEAFAMKESKAREDLADNMHLQDRIAEDRRRLMQRLGLGILLIVLVLVILMRML
ncbi:MAG: hypothetical protein ISS31_08695 [Kiritimatiellae bacterium]|nr:hypothetical protein [Kiritimatiellia bacterium]